MSTTIDNPLVTDNRSYDYSGFPETDREEYPIIAELVPRNARVVDLACGNGSLMELLMKERGAYVQGVELSESGVAVSRRKGLNVVQGRIDAPLPFADTSFDIAVCNVTIQMVMYPEILLKEMKRIARTIIVSFPNLAYYKNRFDLLFQGRMPQPMLFGYQCYSTGHIHQVSLEDFRSLLKEIGGLKIETINSLPMRNPFKRILMNMFPNLFCSLPILLLKRVDE